jgi:hypothetical protein
MPDEVFWPGQSHRGHVMRVAEQAQGGAKEKAESSKKIPRLSDQEFSFFNAAYKARTAATRSQPPVWKKTQASIAIAIKHQIACRQGAVCTENCILNHDRIAINAE